MVRDGLAITVLKWQGCRRGGVEVATVMRLESCHSSPGASDYGATSQRGDWDGDWVGDWRDWEARADREELPRERFSVRVFWRFVQSRFFVLFPSACFPLS